MMEKCPLFEVVRSDNKTKCLVIASQCQTRSAAQTACDRVATGARVVDPLPLCPSAPQAILVVCQDPAAIHSATWNFKDSLRIKACEFMDIIIGTGWSQFMSLIDSFKVFLSFKPCFESDGRLENIAVIFTTTATMGEGRNDDCPQRIDKAVAYVKAKMRQREATLPSVWEAVETTFGPIDFPFISSGTGARQAPAISSSSSERIGSSGSEPKCG
jgi:hypothetical protein